MADELSAGLHIDTDWKRQAQEEKRKLAEEEQRKSVAAAAPAAATPPSPTAAGTGAGRPSAAGRRGARELPPASFASLVNSVMTQAMFYLGELAPQGSEPVVNLDMARHQLDTLGVLEDKTRGNLNEDEQRLLDTALYETRNRFVTVASQYI
jgi:3-oxoacyl-ACP reductase-like protein